MQLKPSKIKIRPKWDWKDWSKLNTTPYALIIKIRPKRDWKIDCYDKAIAKIGKVEIRPKRDWKITRVDLRRVYELGVEIRPKWDWKISYFRLHKVTWTLLKSDQNGIERMLDEMKSQGLLTKLKSDQNGIESLRQLYHRKLSHAISWNQTKMGLKA